MGDEEQNAYKSSDLVKCRFYRNKVPEKDDIVYAEICKIHDVGAYVKLIEYNNIEALILWS